MNNADFSEVLKTCLELEAAPVAVTFCDDAPSGVSRIGSREPAGCGYWRRAEGGESFYTTAEDHFGCPIGCHTHGVELTEGQKGELMGMIGQMVELGYLKEEEIPQIPAMAKPARFVVYSPLDRAKGEPDAVLVKGTARRLMLLAEASQSAGVGADSPTMGRPTCAVLPQTIQTGRAAANFGCVGNRVYTGAKDDEAYFSIPGKALEAVVERLKVVANANTELEKFHRARAAAAKS